MGHCLSHIAATSAVQLSLAKCKTFKNDIFKICEIFPLNYIRSGFLIKSEIV